MSGKGGSGGEKGGELIRPTNASKPLDYTLGYWLGRGDRSLKEKACRGEERESDLPFGPYSVCLGRRGKDIALLCSNRLSVFQHCAFVNQQKRGVREEGDRVLAYGFLTYSVSRVGSRFSFKPTIGPAESTALYLPCAPHPLLSRLDLTGVGAEWWWER